MITLVLIIGLVITLVFSSAISSVFASSDNEEEYIVCNIRLQDGYMVDVILLNPTETNNCERVQQDYTTMTYEEYQRLIEVKDNVGKRFAPEIGPKPSLSEQLRELNEKLDGLSSN